jgi:hypothetical protein
MQYSDDVFEELFLAIRGDQTAFRWLMENDYKELGAFTMALSGKSDAYKWLENNGFNNYSLLIKAAQKHYSAFNVLSTLNDLEYACVVGVVHRDNNSKNWLQDHSYPELIDLALVIRQKLYLNS